VLYQSYIFVSPTIKELLAHYINVVLNYSHNIP